MERPASSQFYAAVSAVTGTAMKIQRDGAGVFYKRDGYHDYFRNLYAACLYRAQSSAANMLGI